MNTIKPFVIICCLVLISGQSALAWGEIGHLAISEIAQRNISAKAAQNIALVLGDQKLPGAANWPDTVRDDKDYDFLKTVHYFDVETGRSIEEKQKNDKKPDDALAALERVYHLLLDSATPRSVKTVALRYFLHIAGDLHQPLHVGNTLDRGGNQCFVIVNPPQVVNLHSAWDSDFIELDIVALSLSAQSEKSALAIQYANDLLKNSLPTAAERRKIEQGQIVDWVNEALQYRSAVYPDQAKSIDQERARTYCGSGRFMGPDQASKLSANYKKQAIEITRKQIMTGAIRTAYWLNKIFEKDGSAGPVKSLSKAEILKYFVLK